MDRLTNSMSRICYSKKQEPENPIIYRSDRTLSFNDDTKVHYVIGEPSKQSLSEGRQEETRLGFGLRIVSIE